MTQRTEYCGYSLFVEVDSDVKNYNRGRIIVNIMEDNSDGNGKISDRGVKLSAGYLLSIPESERHAAYQEAEKILMEKGIINVRN